MEASKGFDVSSMPVATALRVLLGMLSEAMADHQGAQAAYEWRKNIMLPDGDAQPADEVEASAAHYLALLGR